MPAGYSNPADVGLDSVRSSISTPLARFSSSSLVMGLAETFQSKREENMSAKPPFLISSRCFERRNSRQIFVHGANLARVHVGVRRPGHHLKQGPHLRM